MPNTFKKLTFVYIAAALLLPRLLLPFAWSLGLYVSMIHLGIITVPVFGYLAYRSFRKGSVAGATPAGMPDSGTIPPASTTATVGAPNRKWLVAAVAVLAIVLTGYGVRTGYLFVAGVSAPPIEGAYREDAGSKVEFLGDGTMLITIGQSSETARWSRLDAARIRIEPGGVGLLAEVCGYHFTS